MRKARAFVQLRDIAIEHANLKREVEVLHQQTKYSVEVVLIVQDKLVSDDGATRFCR